MSKNSVLYISYDGMTDPLGQSQVIPYLVGLRSYGYRFSLISFEKPENYSQRSGMISELLEAEGIRWYPQVYHKSPPLLSTLYDLWVMRRVAFSLQKAESFHIIHCRSYISAFIGLWMKKRYGTGFVFDMRGFWADERVEGGIWDLKNPIFKMVYRFFKKQEKRFLTEADHIISLTQKAKDILGDWNLKKVQPTRISVIPCCTDMDLFDYRKVEETAIQGLRRQLNIGEEEFVLSYVGSFGTWYMLDEMLHFFQRLKGKVPKARFLMLSKDAPDTVYGKLDTYGISKGSVTVLQSERKDMPRYLMLSHLAIFFIRPVFSKQASSPTKQGEIMGMGIPLVTNAGIGDSDAIIHSSGCGYVIDGFDERSYDSAVDAIPTLLKKNREEIRKGAEEHYSLSEGVQKYAGAYGQVLCK